ncbi:MAG: ABC transporter ATP-binding protein [Chloroflexota bacterium]
MANLVQETALTQHTTRDLLLQVRDLTVTYQTRNGSLNAIEHLNFDMYRGEVLGLVGESGSGKSTLGKALLRMILPPGSISAGQILFDGKNILQFSAEQMRDIRGRQISMIFQDPMTSLNPVQRLDDHIIEAIRVHEPQVSRQEALKRAQELVSRLGIEPRRLNDYPHQLSGGMRQRIMIGLALALKAKLIIADEPTTSLDVIVEAQFLDLLRELKDEYGLTILLISHNIGIVAELADRVAVMYAGQIVEVSDSDQVFHNPLHPYTDGLMKSIPNISLEAEHQTLYRMEGSPPNLINPPSGCRFNPRCPHMMPEICPIKVPPLTLIPTQPSSEHQAACWLHIPHDKPE